MARTQTRKSISIRGSTYRRFRVYCDRHGTSMSELAEGWIAPLIADIPDPGPEARPKPKPERVPALVDEIGKGRKLVPVREYAEHLAKRNREKLAEKKPQAARAEAAGAALEGKHKNPPAFLSTAVQKAAEVRDGLRCGPKDGGDARAEQAGMRPTPAAKVVRARRGVPGAF